MDNDHLDGNVHNINYTNAQTKTSCKTKKQSEGEDEIDKAFDDIVCQETSFVKQGYNDGLVSGVIKQCQEGHKLGLQKGCEIGSEVGYYRGFSLVSLKYLKKKESKSPLSAKQQKCIKVLDKLLKLTEDIPSTNPHPTGTEIEATSVDVSDLLRDMRAKFSLANNLLNVDDSNKQISGSSLNTKNQESSKPKSLAW